MSISCGWACVLMAIAGWTCGNIVIVLLPAQVQHGVANEETPSGVLDGVNVTFNIQHQPLPWSSIKVFENGLRLKRNLDYVLGGPNHTQIIFNACCAPTPGATLIADYNF